MNLNFLRGILPAIAFAAFIFPGSRAAALDRTNEVFKIFQFPPDMSPLPMPANQLNSQILVHTYENDWKDISH